MANKLCDSNKRVIGNITDVVRTVDGETMITLDTGHTFQFKSTVLRQIRILRSSSARPRATIGLVRFST